jgi:hypothetical protein
MSASQTDVNSNQSGVRLLLGILGFIIGTFAILWAVYILIF